MRVRGEAVCRLGDKMSAVAVACRSAEPVAQESARVLFEALLRTDEASEHEYGISLDEIANDFFIALDKRADLARLANMQRDAFEVSDASRDWNDISEGMFLALLDTFPGHLLDARIRVCFAAARAQCRCKKCKRAPHTPPSDEAERVLFAVMLDRLAELL